MTRTNEVVNNWLAWVAVAALVAAMLITVGNMFMRAFYDPFDGAFEVVGWLTAVTTAFALGYTQLKKGHISIDLLFSRMKPRTRSLVDVVGAAAGMVIFALLSWQMFLYGAHLEAIGSTSETLRIGYYPFVYAVALGCGGLVLALLVDVSKRLSDLLGRTKPYW